MNRERFIIAILSGAIVIAGLAVITKTLYPRSEFSKVSHEQNEKLVDDYNRFEVQIRESDLMFEVIIDKIDFIVKKGAFSVTQEKYTKPILVDGYQLQVSFSIKNPYNKEYIVPIDDHFTIGSRENAFLSLPRIRRGFTGAEYYPHESFKHNNGTKVKAARAFPISFKPNEAKQFTLVFPPITNDVKHITLLGFHVKGYRFNYMMKDFILGLVIDVQSKKIMAQKRYSDVTPVDL